VKLGFENRKQTIAAAVLGVVALLIMGYWFIPSSSTIASTSSGTVEPVALPSNVARPPAHHGSGSAPGKKQRPPQNLDPTLHLQQLAVTEQITYEGSGRNIFISQADAIIPTPLTTGTTDKADKDKKDAIYTPPILPQQPPIPLKFFGFANRPGEAKKVFLSKGDDVFIAGEGEIVDRRYKVVRISATSVDIQDVVGSGPPQSIPLTQGNPS
jgi:hypothetical protein